MTDKPSPAITEAAQIETPAEGERRAEAVNDAPPQVHLSPWPLANHPGDELAALRERNRLERGESAIPYADSAASAEYKSYINRLLSMAGLEPARNPQ